MRGRLCYRPSRNRRGSPLRDRLSLPRTKTQGSVWRMICRSTPLCIWGVLSQSESWFLFPTVTCLRLKESERGWSGRWYYCFWGPSARRMKERQSSSGRTQRRCLTTKRTTNIIAPRNSSRCIRHHRRDYRHRTPTASRDTIRPHTYSCIRHCRAAVRGRIWYSGWNYWEPFCTTNNRGSECSWRRKRNKIGSMMKRIKI